MNKIKKMPIMIIGTIIILTTTIFAATGKVNAPSGLVLRDEPSRSGSPITTVKDDANVEIIEKSGEWYKVKYNAQEGYLFAQYVETIETTNNPENPDTNQANQTNSEIKLYKMPLITSTPIGTIAKGTEVTVVKEVTNWSYITGENIEGWVRTYLIKGEQLPAENPEKPEGTETKPTNDEQTEQPAETPNPETPNNSETPTTDNNQETAIVSKKAIVNVSAANVRKEPSTSSAIVTTLTKNTDIIVNAETGEWYKITYIDVDGTTYEGYMSKTLVKIN